MTYVVRNVKENLCPCVNNVVNSVLIVVCPDSTLPLFTLPDILHSFLCPYLRNIY